MLSHIFTLDKSRLLLGLGFFHGHDSGLRGGLWFAGVRVELRLDGSLRAHVGVSCELRVALFTDSEHGDAPDPLHRPKIALCHADSFPQRQRLGYPAPILAYPPRFNFQSFNHEGHEVTRRKPPKARPS